MSCSQLGCMLTPVVQFTKAAEGCCGVSCSQLPEGAKTRLAARLSPQMIPPGHDLCQEGDDADCMWILQEGNPTFGPTGQGRSPSGTSFIWSLVTQSLFKVICSSQITLCELQIVILVFCISHSVICFLAPFYVHCSSWSILLKLLVVAPHRFPPHPPHPFSSHPTHPSPLHQLVFIHAT